MKKIAIAAAIAALSVPAFAQSSVTLWGRINTTVENIKENGGDRKAVVNNNASRLGFKGTEDLGGGLKVSFSLEHGLNSDTGVATGGTAFWNREASVQIAGDFGAIRLGRWTPGSYYATADYVSMHNHDTGTSEDRLYSGAGFTTTNKVGYFTPNINGFNGEVALHAGEGVDQRGYDVALNYDQGPLHLGAGYSAVNSNNQFGLRALYTFGQFTVGGYYQRNKDDNQFVAGGAGTRNNFRLSGMYALGASEFHVNVGRAGKWSRLGSDTDATQWTLGYNYNLSKRTKLYGYYTRVNNGTFAYKGTADQDFSSIALGMRHNF